MLRTVATDEMADALASRHVCSRNRAHACSRLRHASATLAVFELDSMDESAPRRACVKQR